MIATTNADVVGNVTQNYFVLIAIRRVKLQRHVGSVVKHGQWFALRAMTWSVWRAGFVNDVFKHKRHASFVVPSAPP